MIHQRKIDYRKIYLNLHILLPQISVMLHTKFACYTKQREVSNITRCKPETMSNREK